MRALKSLSLLLLAGALAPMAMVSGAHAQQVQPRQPQQVQQTQPRQPPQVRRAARIQIKKYRNPTAVFAGLDKITGRIIAFEAGIDETVQFGSLLLTARICWTRSADALPRTTTFLEAEEVGADNQTRRIFSGWMIAQSPGLNAIDHAVYDVWLTDCKGGTEKDAVTVESEPEEEDPSPEAPRPPPTQVRQVQPIQNRPSPNATNAPLVLPSGRNTPTPPGDIRGAPRPNQSFFPTNQPSRGAPDPAGGNPWR